MKLLTERDLREMRSSKTFTDYLVIYGSVGMLTGAIVGVFIAIVRDNRAVQKEVNDYWRGAQIARICKSGDAVWKHRDGHLMTRWGTDISQSDPKEVCE